MNVNSTSGNHCCALLDVELFVLSGVDTILFHCSAVSVDLRVSRIYRHLAASPSFEAKVAGAGGTPRLS